MENYDRVLEITTASQNSAGTSAEKYGAYMDSIEAKLNTLTATWEQFVNNLNQGGTFKGIVDIITKLVEVLDLLLNKFGLLNIIVPVTLFTLLATKLKSLINHFAVIGLSVNNFKNSLSLLGTVTTTDTVKIQELANALAGLSVKQKLSILSTSGLSKEVKKQILVVSGLTDAEAEAALKTTAFGKANILAGTKVGVLRSALDGLKAAFLSNPIGIAITAITTAISIGTMAWQKYNEKIQETIDKGKELSESYNTFVSDNQSSISSLKSLQEEFDRLSVGVSDYGENISLSADDYSRYKDIVSEILGYSPELISGYDNEGKAIANKNGLLEKSIELMRQEQKLRLESFVSEDIPDIGAGKIEEYKKQIEELERLEKDFVSFTGAESIFDPGFWGDEIKKRKNIKLQELLGFEDIDAKDRTVFQVYGKEIIERAQDIYNMMLKNTDLFTKQDLEIFSKYLTDKAKLTGEIEKASSALNPSLQFIPQIVDGYDELTEYERAFVSDYINTFKLIGGESEETIDQWVNDITGFTEALTTAEPQVREKINRMFTLNPDDFSASEYRDKIYELLTSITEELGLTQEQQLNLAIKFGLTVVDENGRIIDTKTQMEQEILKKFEGLVPEDLKDLSYAELTILVNAEGVDDLTGSGLPEFLEELKAKTAEVNSEFSDMPSALSSLAEEFANISTQYDELISASDEFNTYGAISSDTLKSLADNNLLQYLEFTENGLVVNTNAFRDNAEAVREKKIEDIKMTLYEQLMAIALDTTTEASEGAATGVNNAGNAAEIASQKFAKGIPSVVSYAEALKLAAEVGGVNLDAWSGHEKEAIAAIDQYNKAMQLATTVNYGFAGSSSNAGSATKKLSEELKNEKEAIEDLIEAFIKMFKQQLKDQKELIQKQKEAENDRYDQIKKNFDEEERQQKRLFEDKKDKIEELRDLDNDYYEDRIDALDKELDAYNKKINAQKELLQAKKEEQEYEKDLEEKVKDVAKIQSELAKLQFDDSIEAQKKKIELAEQLAEKQGDLDDFQADHNYELQEDALDKEQQRFEELQNAKKEALEQEKSDWEDYWDERLKSLEKEEKAWKRAFEDRETEAENFHDNEIKRYEEQITTIEDQINNEKQLRLDAIEAIDTANEELYKQLREWNRTYGTGIDRDIIDKWEVAQGAIEKYNGICNGTQQILEHLAGQLEEISEKSNNMSSGMQRYANSVKDAHDNVLELKKEIQRINKESKDMELSGGMSFKYGGSSSGMYEKSHTGEDYVQPRDDEDRKISKAMGLKSDEVVRILKVGEAVIPKNENLQRLKSNPQMLSQNTVYRTNEISKNSQSYSTDNRSDINISIGDTIIQGNADNNVINKLGEYKKAIVNEVFSKINKHTNLSGFRSVKRYV
jgi:hypothetical protein